MSELATEITNSSTTLTTVEFLGQDFADRRKALGQAATFYEMTKQALADSVEVLVGQDVHMVFRPGSTTVAQYKGVWVSCYSLSDEERKPLARDVRVLSMDEQRSSVVLGANPQEDGSFDQEWIVRLANIFSIAQPEANDRLF